MNSMHMDIDATYKLFLSGISIKNMIRSHTVLYIKIDKVHIIQIHPYTLKLYNTQCIASCIMFNYNIIKQCSGALLDNITTAPGTIYYF